MGDDRIAIYSHTLSARLLTLLGSLEFREMFQVHFFVRLPLTWQRILRRSGLRQPVSNHAAANIR
jgi:hypothetical protein